MKSLDVFRKDKNDFIVWFTLYSTITFLALCVLFGLYIYCSFHNVSSMEQTANGNENYMEMNK